MCGQEGDEAVRGPSATLRDSSQVECGNHSSSMLVGNLSLSDCLIDEVAFLALAQDPQDGTDGARAGGQDGPDGEGLGLGPDAVGEQWCEGSQDDYHLGWQIHGVRLRGRGLVYHRRSSATPPGSASQLRMEQSKTIVRVGQSRVSTTALLAVEVVPRFLVEPLLILCG